MLSQDDIPTAPIRKPRPIPRWAVEIYPEEVPILARRGTVGRMTVRFNVRADSRDEALCIAQEHRPDLKSWIWAIEPIKENQ